MFHLVRHMSIHIQSKCRRMMAEIILDRLDVVPRLERHHGERVAEVVEARGRGSNLGHDPLEAAPRPPGPGNGAGLSVLGRGQVIFAALLLLPPQLALDGDGAPGEVHAVPHQAEDFPLPHPGNNATL